MEKRCIIVSGGRPGPAPQPQPGDFVIACDRGYRYCAGLGLQPDLFIGDFDSYDGAVDPAVPVERLQPEKDDTDTGHAIRHALDQGCRNFIIGIGGSATNDGGTGMLHALGCHFRKADGTDIDREPVNCRNLHRLTVRNLIRVLPKATLQLPAT